jgi:hypothetical protein
MRFGLLLLGLALTGSLAAAPAPAKRQIAVLNDSNSAMLGLQARVPKQTIWQNDILGRYAIGVGLAGKVMLPASGCVYDMLASFDDGSRQQILGVDTCKPGPVVFKGS